MPRAAHTYYEAALAGMLASGFFAMLGSGQLDRPTTIILLLALGLRGLALGGWLAVEIPPLAANAAAAAYVLFYPVDYYWLSRSFIAATVHMILFVAVVKLLTARTARDYLYLKVIAGLELLAAAVLSTHISFFLFLATFVLSAIAAFSAGEILRGSRQPVRVSRPASQGMPWRLSGTAVSLFAGILLMTTALFFVLPRSARAAFERFVPQRRPVSGFGSELTLGELGEIRQNHAPVLHVRAYDGRPLAGLRWRGRVLSGFDGRRWFNPPEREQRLIVDNGRVTLPPGPRTRPGRSLGYQVQMSAIAPDTLFFAGTPETISIQARALFRSPSGTIRAPRFGMAGLRYGAYSRIENELRLPDAPPPPLDPELQRALLALPPLDPRIAEVARRWTAGVADPEARARAIEAHFHRDFRYSLDMGTTAAADPLAHFLFERRAGHCEYFASAMAVMLRSLGIPARIATGFLGGVYNSLSGWQVIRASDAHSWVEAYIAGRGWMSFDPTPPDPSAAAPPSLWSRALLLLDAADQFWRDWVLGYDFDRQLVLASRLQTAGRGWRQSHPWPAWDFARAGNVDGRLWAAAAAVVGTLGLLLWRGRAWRAWWVRRRRLDAAQRGRAQPADATLLYEAMLGVLKRRGFEKPAPLTPREFARVLPPTEWAPLVAELTESYNAVRFGGRADAARRMAHLLRRIETLLA
jgi:transglutaminase-like putative cysteine protease